MERITSENWTHTSYNSTQLKAFIGLVAEPVTAPDQDVPVLYAVTLTDMDHQELFQKDFPELSLAVDFINKRYGHWEFIDAEKKGEGSCGSCSAH